VLQLCSVLQCVTSSGEELGVDCVESLLVDQPSWTLILETAVHLLDLHRGEPETDELFGDDDHSCDFLPCSLA
jgi:hypothetical protein